MRAVNISAMIGRVQDHGVHDALREIELASAEWNTVDIVAPYIVSGTFTETRTLNVTAPTIANIAAVLATLIKDMQRGGESRST